MDATCGNGGDTLWLSRAVGPTGHVLALDIQVKLLCNLGGHSSISSSWDEVIIPRRIHDLQEEALKSTRHLLDTELPPHLWPKLDLVQDCHSNLKVCFIGHVVPRDHCLD